MLRKHSHIFLRPTTSANQPKKSCPTKVPTGVATLTPRSWLTLSFPPGRRGTISRLATDDKGREKLTGAIDITQHGGGDVDGEDVIAIAWVRGNARYRNRSHDHVRIGEETNTSDQADPYVEPPVVGDQKGGEEGDDEGGRRTRRGHCRFQRGRPYAVHRGRRIWTGGQPCRQLSCCGKVFRRSPFGEVAEEEGVDVSPGFSRGRKIRIHRLKYGWREWSRHEDTDERASVEFQDPSPDHLSLRVGLVIFSHAQMPSLVIPTDADPSLVTAGFGYGGGRWRAARVGDSAGVGVDSCEQRASRMRFRDGLAPSAPAACR